MERRPIIMINTDNFPMMCDSRCENRECSRHISKLSLIKGGCKISKLKGTEKCEGHIPRKRTAKVQEEK
jgi:hypothetical protein